jgi:hypothetical protein
MGGSGGSGPFTSSRSPEDLARLAKKAEDATSVAAFEAQLASVLAELLSSYNSRDAALVRERIEELTQALEGKFECTIDQFFGGSVAKHTYVDGLSDVDTIVIINDTGLKQEIPRVVLEALTSILAERMHGRASVHHGRMAVSIEYDDGMLIQLLPAVRSPNGGIRVPSSRREGWSKIELDGFRDALVRRNQECGGKLVPTIKLAKAINGTLPEALRLSGYHMESLGIAAFRNYSGVKTTAAMLPAFFERARELVLSPIRDSTGQSIHVDEYLGPRTARNASL